MEELYEDGEEEMIPSSIQQICSVFGNVWGSGSSFQNQFQNQVTWLKHYTPIATAGCTHVCERCEKAKAALAAELKKKDEAYRKRCSDWIEKIRSMRKSVNPPWEEGAC